MLFIKGKRYIFMTQRYAFSGTVVEVTPTHIQLGDDAKVHYEDVGMLYAWSSGERRAAQSGKEGPVPGQIISALGTEATLIP